MTKTKLPTRPYEIGLDDGTIITRVGVDGTDACRLHNEAADDDVPLAVWYRLPGMKNVKVHVR